MDLRMGKNWGHMSMGLWQGLSCQDAVAPMGCILFIFRVYDPLLKILFGSAYLWKKEDPDHYPLDSSRGSR